MKKIASVSGVATSAVLLLSVFSVFLCMVGSVSAQDKAFTNTIGMEFVLIPSGSFMMGSDKNFEECDNNETPSHKVIISKEFYIGKYEVTQEQWVAIMGTNPSKFKGKTNPVEQISWDDAQLFIRKMNKKEGIDRYRLPTEAEWEYACRAATVTAYSFGNDKKDFGQYGWYEENSGGQTHMVGQLLPNAWGLYDMHGNVWEWCQDWYDKKYYTTTPSIDPLGASSGSYRVRRGGGWIRPATNCRSASRICLTQGHSNSRIGVRIVLSTEQQ